MTARPFNPPARPVLCRLAGKEVFTIEIIILYILLPIALCVFLYKHGKLLWTPLIIHLVIDITVFALLFKYNFQNAYANYSWTAEKDMSIVLSKTFLGEGWGIFIYMMLVSTLWYFICTIITVIARHLLLKNTPNQRELQERPHD